MTAHKIADAIYQKLTGQSGLFASRIAYVTKNGSQYKLQIADADGADVQPVLASNQPIISPSWSPDGSQLAYVSYEKKKPIIYVQSLLSGKRTEVAKFKGNNSAPAWSPDGRQLAVVLTYGANSQIYKISAAGGTPQPLTKSSAIDTEPTWSPDGKSIYFTSDRGGSPQIYRMSSSGGDAQRVTFEGNYNVSPRISPDGKLLAFIKQMSGGFKLSVQELASGQVRVLSDNREDESPAFSPNSRMLLYATSVNGKGVLAASAIDGKIKQRLNEASGDVREVAWGPLIK
jgi:TolB protein